jgi:hypothetical protein
MYLRPADPWPRHSRPQAGAALEAARAAGWWFKPSGGHTFGRLRCLPPEHAAGSDACKVPIYSTSGAADGSDTARVIRDALRKCPHDRSPVAAEPDPEASGRLASGKLAKIAALIDAAESLVAERSARREANEVIDGALRQLAEDQDAAIDHLDEAAAQLGRRAETEHGRAYSAALRAGAGEPWPPAEGAEELAELAQRALQEAMGLIVRAASSEGIGRLEAERDRLVARLERLSILLETSR